MAQFDTLQSTLDALARAKGETFRERIQFLVRDGTIPPEEGPAYELWGRGMDNMHENAKKMRDHRISTDRHLRLGGQ